MQIGNLMRASAACAFAVLTLAPAHAAPTVVDFTGSTAGTPVASTYAALGLTFTNAVFGQCSGGCPAPNPATGWFAYSGGGASFTAYFATPQTSVSFQSVTFSSTLAQAYTAINTLVGSVTDEQSYPATGQVDTITSATPFTSIVFSYNGGYNGPAITNLAFNSVPTGTPEPAAWALMIAGFGAVGAVMRRQRGLRLSYT